MLSQRISNDNVMDSLSEMHRLHEQLNRLLSLANLSAATDEFPAINVWTSEEGALVRTELPGVPPEQVDISLVNDTLTIKGQRCSESTEDDQRCHRLERGFGQFARSIKLPFAVEPEAVNADFRDGILQIELPRAAVEKPRKISVRSA
ncbi:Hsp20/alpha crystallin family protein [soil metagenome]